MCINQLTAVHCARSPLGEGPSMKTQVPRCGEVAPGLWRDAAAGPGLDWGGPAPSWAHPRG